MTANSETTLRTFARRVLPPLGLIIIVVILGLGMYVGTLRYYVRNHDPIDPHIGIDQVLSVDIGGTSQWISIRGYNRTLPPLLYLGGGPGSPNLAFIRHHIPELEHHFVVITWDPPGAGKSYDGRAITETLSVAQLGADVVDLVRYLTAALDHEQIYLMGHSWGGYLGLSAIEQAPELFHRFFCISPFIDGAEGDRISHEFTWAQAQLHRDTTSIEQLERIGTPPIARDSAWDYLQTQRRLLLHYGGHIHHHDLRSSLPQRQRQQLIGSPEYSLGDLLFRLPRAPRHSLEILWDDMQTLDARHDFPELEVPVHFLVGRYDYLTPISITHQYYQNLVAPEKTWIWFEESAHSPHVEETHTFMAMLQDLIPAP